MSDHLAWIADALGAPRHVVTAAEHNGDLLALVFAAGVRHLRGAADGAPRLEDDRAWLPELLAAAHAVMDENEITARTLRDAAENPLRPASARLAQVLSTMGGGRAPAPAVLGKLLRSVVGIEAGGLRLEQVSQRGNVGVYVVSPVEEQ